MNPTTLFIKYQVAAQAAGPDFIISFEPMIAAIVDDVLQGKTASYISCCFHNTVAQVIADICGRITSAGGH